MGEAGKDRCFSKRGGGDRPPLPLAGRFHGFAEQIHRPSAWQVKRILTEERVPGTSAIAKFVGVEAYEAAGGKLPARPLLQGRRQRRLVRRAGAPPQPRHREAARVQGRTSRPAGNGRCPWLARDSIHEAAERIASSIAADIL